MRCLCIMVLLFLPPTTEISATTWSVNSGGSGDFPTIQAALDAAEPGDLILLDSGTYSGTGNRDIRFEGKAVTVRSAAGDAAGCIIDCEGSSGDPHRGFLFLFGEDSDSVIEDVKIINGFEYAGGGIYCANNSSPQIVDCILTDNEASHYGGGIYCHQNALPEIIGTIFQSNIAGLLGGGLFCDSNSPAVVSGCTFAGNESPSGGGLFYKSCSASIAQTTLNGNSATYGSGIYTNNSNVTVDAVLITSGQSGSAVYYDGGSSVTLINSNLFANVGGDWVDGLEDQAAEDGNLSVDPQFCEENPNVAANWQLDSTSLCLAAFHDGVTIGAWGVGCGADPVQRESWGSIKELYRARP